MHETISHLIATYGYLFLFVLVAVESFGVPLPGETALVTAAAYAALGRLNIVFVIVAAAAGAIVGDNAGYWLGRKGGIAFVHRYGRHVGLDDAKLARVHAFFERHGAKTVFIGRFVALLRSWAAVLAGAGRMPYLRFTFFNLLGGIIWASLFGMLGYAFGHNLPTLERYAGQVTLALVLLAALGVAIVLSARWFQANSARISDAIRAGWQRVARSPLFARLRERHPDLWSFVAARLVRGEYLGLHLTIGFIVSLLALWLFGGVTEDVINHDPLTAVDLQLAAWLRAHASSVGDRIGVAVTTLGSPAVVGILVVIVAAVLAYRRWWIVLVGWLAANAGGGVLDLALKRIIHRARPTGSGVFLYGSTFSFPSGHAMGSLIGYGMLAYLLISFWAPARRHRTAVILGTAVLVLLIGLSRLYLGVHFLSDVIGGYAAGTVWLATCVTGVELALRQRGLAPWDVGVERRSETRVAPTSPP
jgi:membrane protein DedA with SNARE-associated domain/membrane-associated phospholipid phosphatase